MSATEKPYQMAVVIGRFQIFHVGHELLLQHALTIANKVIIVIGSSHHARTPLNPFTWEERKEMIIATLLQEQKKKVICMPVRDYFNDHRWTAAVKKKVQMHCLPSDKIALVGHKKQGDTSNYYLNHFPYWNLVEIESPYNVNAAELRKTYFEVTNITRSLQEISTWISQPVGQLLQKWSTQQDYPNLGMEQEALLSKKAELLRSSCPFSLTSVHALVESNGKVLLSQKKKFPGKGLWMLPGGFIEPTERLALAAIRHLSETTNITFSEAILLKQLTKVKVFDHPNRSCLGRVITHVHWFQLSGKELFQSKSTEQLSNYQWFPIATIINLEEQLYEDHFHIMGSFYQLLHGEDN